MAYEYLASVQSAARRFNDRMVQIAKNLGADSPIIEDMMAKLDVLMPNNYRIKDGVPQIIKPKQIYDDPEKNQQFESMMETVPTWGSIRKEIEPQYEAYKEQERFFGGEPVEFRQFVKTMLSLPEAIRVASEQKNSRALEILTRRGRRKTYAELTEVANIIGG